jgi:two-component system, cell cycle sensor histidine kinase and response regulator CckA
MYVITRNENGVPFVSDCNEMFLSSTGFAREEALGKPLTTLYSAESSAELLEGGGYARAMAGEFFIGERELVTRDGRIIPTLLYTATELDASGQVIGTRAMFVDITEQKKVEAALRTSEAQLSSALIMARLGPWIYDVPKDLFTCNDHFFKVFRTSAVEVGGYTLSSDEYARHFVYSDDLPAVCDEIRKAIENTDPHFSGHMEHRIIYADGEIGYIACRYFTVTDDIGHTVKIYGVNQDITERKRAEEALAKQLEFMTELMEAIPLPVFFKNVDHVYVGCNTAFAQFVDLPKERIVGKSVFDVVSKDTAEIFRERDEELFHNPGTQVYSTSVKRSDGGMRDVLFHKATYGNRDGKVSGLIGAILDVTERKILEQRLLQAQKMQAIGTLTAGIAHEFNNLLTVVSGYAELLLTERNEGDPEFGDLQRIMNAAHKGAELIKNLLTFSRKSQTALICLDLNHEVTQIKKLLDSTLPKAIVIELELSDGLKTIRADSGQIRQIIMNLALNARDAMPLGGKLKVATNNIDLHADQGTTPTGAKPGDYVQLIVSDTGIGMDTETLERIFEPFYSSKGLAYKTGLGLALVHGIVEQHGGFICCESEPGRGATFKVYFPAANSLESEDASRETRSSRGTETVLLVDDEEHVRDLAARLLGREGYRVITAEDGRRAVEIYRKERNSISLVILDLIMPKMDGTQCLRELLKIDPKTKVIIATGYSDGSNSDEFIRAGAKGFLGKPFQGAFLLKTVRDVLDIA